MTAIGDTNVSDMDYDQVIAAIKAKPGRPLTVSCNEPPPVVQDDSVDMLHELEGLDFGPGR